MGRFPRDTQTPRWALGGLPPASRPLLSPVSLSRCTETQNLTSKVFKLENNQGEGSQASDLEENKRETLTSAGAAA